MTIEELAREKGIAPRHLIKKAKLIDLYPSGPKDTLKKDEMTLLAIIANWSSAKISGFTEALENKNIREKIQLIGGGTNDKDWEENERLHDKFRPKKTPIKPLKNEVKGIDKSKLKEVEKQIRRVENNLKKSITSEVDNLFQLFNSELEEVKDLNSKVKNELTAKIENISNHSKKLQNDVKILYSQVEELNKKIESLINNDESEEFEELSFRISKAIDSSFKKRNSLPKFKPPYEIQESFLAINLAFPEKLIQDIIIGLKQRNIVIAGPPGIGKTSLLKNINLFFDMSPEECNIPYHCVLPEWDSYDILGGKKLLGSKLTPHLGLFVENAINCIETNKSTFLILDELNRGKADDLFSGLMGWLSSNDGILNFKEFSLIQRRLDKIKIPSNFRLIGAMNNTDQQFLYSMSNQLKRRFSFINFNKPDELLEREVLNKLVKSHKNRLRRITKDNSQIRIFDEIIAIINVFRNLENDLNFNETLIGTSYIVKTLQQLGELIECGYVKTLDELFNENFMGCLKGLQPNTKQKIISEILLPYQLNNCIKTLSSINI